MCASVQATEHAQREAAHAAEELAQTQLELGQSREAEQRALDAQSSLEQERATLREALGKRSLLVLTFLSITTAGRRESFHPYRASCRTYGSIDSHVVPQRKHAVVKWIVYVCRD